VRAPGLDWEDFSALQAWGGKKEFVVWQAEAAVTGPVTAHHESTR